MDNKKTIKLNFCSFWGSFDKKNNLFANILSKHFNVELSDEPDFVICSNRGDPFEYMKYDCVRIMFMGEEISPDFTTFDYCIGFDDIIFDDRYLKFPLAFFADKRENAFTPVRLNKSEAENILQKKDIFCNFIYLHKSTGMREKLFYEISEYKKVTSPGALFNNVDGSTRRCSWSEKSKYLRRSKFTIAAECLDYPGYATEKIIQPFEQHSIPIFWGNSKMDEYFNEKAFVWCRSENDIDRVVDEIR